MEFVHESVLLQESVSQLRVNPDGIYADGTLGGGGHSALICEHLSTDGMLIGIDRDTSALEAAQKRLEKFQCHKRFFHRNFFEIDSILQEMNLPLIDGAILDLGVSSPQLDRAERGFSYHREARLDMRMDQESELDAYQVVNTYDEARLADIIFRYGEERYSRRIAAAIGRERKIHPIETTTQLAEVIKQAFPASARYGDKHPAKRTFQAIRIEVNGELDGLEAALRSFVSHLKPGGRLAVITFHSLEDRIVKNTFGELAKGCVCPKDFPVCVCGRKPEIALVNRKPMVAGKAEQNHNKRAHSAKLRVIEKQ